MLKGLFGRSDAISAEGCADTVDLVEARAALAPAPLDLLAEAKEAVRLMAERGIGFNETRLRAAIEQEEIMPRSVLKPKGGPRL